MMEPVMSVVEAAAWHAPVMDGFDARPTGRNLTGEQLREEQRRLLAAAEAQGRASGLASAQKEIDAKLKVLEEKNRSLQAALNALSRPLAQVDDVIHEQITMLALELARGLLRRELRTDPSQV